MLDNGALYAFVFVPVGSGREAIYLKGQASVCGVENADKNLLHVVDKRIVVDIEAAVRAEEAQISLNGAVYRSETGIILLKTIVFAQIVYELFKQRISGGQGVCLIGSDALYRGDVYG